jgi:hypothetical protein
VTNKAEPPTRTYSIVWSVRKSSLSRLQYTALLFELFVEPTRYRVSTEVVANYRLFTYGAGIPAVRFVRLQHAGPWQISYGGISGP